MKKALIGIGAAAVLAAAVYLLVWPVSGFNMEKDWRCSIRNGEMVATGCGIAGCHYECARVYPDAGKRCDSSRDCRGMCLVYADFLLNGPPGGPGTCAETSLIRNCSNAYELTDDGSVTSVGQCTM